MTVSRSDLLFHEKDLGKLINGYEAGIRQEVEGWERNKILAASEPDLIAYLVEKYTLDPPRLLRDDIHIESEGETKIDVSADPLRHVRDRSRPFYIPGSYVTVAIPFEGDADLFGFQASTRSYNPPYGQVSGSTVLISFQDVKLDPQRIRQEIDTTVGRIEEHLKWIKNDCDGWNGRIQAGAEQCVRNRKDRLLEQATPWLADQEASRRCLQHLGPISSKEAANRVAADAEGGIPARTSAPRFGVRLHSYCHRPTIAEHRTQPEHLRPHGREPDS